MEFWFYFNIGIATILFSIIVTTQSFEKVPRLFKGIFLALISYYLSKKKFDNMTIYNVVSGIILTLF